MTDLPNTFSEMQLTESTGSLLSPGKTNLYFAGLKIKKDMPHNGMTTLRETSSFAFCSFKIRFTAKRSLSI